MFLFLAPSISFFCTIRFICRSFGASAGKNHIVLLQLYEYHFYYWAYWVYCSYSNCSGWLQLVGSRILYELDYRKPVLYVIPIQSILGKLPVVPVGGTGTIPHHLRNLFAGAPGDSKPGADDGCQMWFVKSWALPHWDGPVICNEMGRDMGRPSCSIAYVLTLLLLLLLIDTIIANKKINHMNWLKKRIIAIMWMKYINSNNYLDMQ